MLHVLKLLCVSAISQKCKDKCLNIIAHKKSGNSGEIEFARQLVYIAIINVCVFS